MIFFEKIKTNLRLSFYYPNRSENFDRKHLLITFAWFLNIVLNFIFLIYETESIDEYVSSAYLITTIIGIFLSYIDTTLKTATIFRLIDESEKVFINRKRAIEICKHLFNAISLIFNVLLLFVVQDHKIHHRRQCTWKRIG